MVVQAGIVSWAHPCWVCIESFCEKEPHVRITKKDKLLVWIVTLTTTASPLAAWARTVTCSTCNGYVDRRSTCACAGYPVAYCDPGFGSNVFYYFCKGTGNSADTCTDSWRYVGQDWECETNMDWLAVTLCLAGATGCIVVCLAPPWIACAACVVALTGCGGCNIMDCDEKPGTRVNQNAWSC